jgi:hypothetical protein
MASITFAIDDELRPRIDGFPWINWSELAREEILKRLETEDKLKRLKEIVSKSQFTEKDAEELGKKVNKSLHNKYRKLYSDLL